MNKIATPIRFQPFLRPMVWGGRALAGLNKTLPTEETYGESWDVSDHPQHRSVVASGPLAGTTLRRLMEEYREPLLGPAAPKHTMFPWLFKFLDACDWLSVQVHPDEVAVKKWWPGEGSKTEAWFILEARPGSRIYAGLLPGVGPAEFRAAVEQGRAQECLHSFAPQPGQCVFLPAGTVHAVGGGVLMAEIQQTSDATFRLFDWNRRDAQGRARQLHIEEGLACIDWKQGPVHPVQVADFRASASPALSAQPLVRCRHFHLDYVSSLEPIAVGATQRLQLIVIVAGAGRFPGIDDQAIAGQAWLLPADLPPTHLTPDHSVAMLRCTLPE